MAIDTKTERVVRLTNAPSYIPHENSKKASIETIYRWADPKRGVRGTILESCMIGGVRHTSIEAIERFLAAQNVAKTPAPQITQAQRNRQGEAAMRQLEACGV